MDETFEKKRRNLLITSILLIIIQYAQVTISTDVKTSFIGFKIQEPLTVMYIIFIIHIYLLIRFLLDRPIKSYTFTTLFYAYRMRYFAEIIFPKYNEHINYCDGVYDERQNRNKEGEYEDSITPTIKNEAIAIFREKEIKREKIYEITKQIEKIDRFQFRWQFREGREDDDTASLYNFSKKEVFLSYPSAILPLFVGNQFSLYHLPLFLGSFSAISFIFYLKSYIE